MSLLMLSPRRPYGTSLVQFLWCTCLACWLAITTALPAKAAEPMSLRIGVLRDGWPPFSIVQPGQVSGISIDFLQAALGEPSVVLIPRAYPDMNALLAAACAGEVDVVLNVGETAERARCLRFSHTYFDADTVVSGRAARDTQQAPSFDRARLAVEPGFFLEGRMRARYPQATLVIVKHPEDGLRAIAEGRADYYPTLQPVLDYYLARPEFSGLAVVASYREPGGGLHFAFAPGAAALQIRVNRGLVALSDSARQAIVGRWVTPPLNPGPPVAAFFLTPEERAFLAALPVLRVGFDSAAAPYSYLDDSGRPSGMAADHLAYLSRTLGIRFQREREVPFAQAVEAMHARRLDLMAVAVREDPALNGLAVTRPYATFPLVVVGRQSAVAVENLKDLAGRHVAVNEASGVREIAAAIPGVRLSMVRTVQAGMAMVAEGHADVYLDDLASVDVEMRRHFAGTLRIIGSGRRTLDMGLALSPALAARLLPLIDRAIAHMPEEERLEIQSRYMAVSAAEEPSWRQILRRIGPYLAGVVILMAVLLRSQFLLRREAAARQRAQQQLQDQLDFQHTLMDAVPIPITVKDRDGRYLAVNAASTAWAGLAPDQMVGHLPTEAHVLGNEAAAALEAGARRALESGQAQRFAIEYREPGGAQRYFLGWAQPLADDKVASAGVITAAVDVTEIHEARQRAQQLQQRLTDITDSLPLIVFQVRRLHDSGEALWEATYVAGGVGGLEFEELTKAGPRTSLTTRLHPDDIPQLLEVWDAAAHANEPMEFECRMQTAQDLRWVSIRAVPRLTQEGALWNGVIVDITERRAQAQALQEAKEAAEAALRAKESFLAMMSHEIRTPMNGILGLIELLKGTSLTTAQQRMVGLAQESGHALGQILDDILDYAKIEAARLSITPRPLDLRELCDGVMGALLPQAFEKGLHLKQLISADVPASVQADGIRLRQILFNLLGNAIKFTEQGSVMLHATIEPRKGGRPLLVVNVEDTGIGIAKDDLVRLFAPFAQIERSTTRRHGGTGLGLSIARRLAELMEGELLLRSVEGVGTTATLRVPCEVAAQSYNLPLLKDRPLIVHVADPIKRAALLAYGQTASMQCLNPETPPSLDDIAIVDQPASAVARRHAMCLTGELLPLGFREDEHGIWLADNPLRWSAFVSALETLLKHDALLPAPVSAPPSDSSSVLARRILVVEDHAISQEVIQQQLASMGYSSVVCNNGEEALAALDAGNFDLVLTDCHMPVMDGFDLTRAIRNSDDVRVRAMPVVGLTATIVREEHLLCTISGMDTFLIKPATMAALRETIEASLQGRSSAASRKTAGELASNAMSSDALPYMEGFITHRVDADALRSWLSGMLPDGPGRERFQQALQADRAALLTQIEAPSVQALHKWCHRAGGALSALEQPYLRELVHRFDEVVQGGNPDEVRTMGQSLVKMYDYLVSLAAEMASL